MSDRKLSPEQRAGDIVDAWEHFEGETMRDGHRATLERLIASQIREAADAARREEREGHVKMTVYANQLEHQVREQAEEIERLKKERDGAIKQALEQHRIVQDLGRELRAANGRTERAEKALRSVLTHPDTTGRLQELVSEALRPAAPQLAEWDARSRAEKPKV